MMQPSHAHTLLALSNYPDPSSAQSIFDQFIVHDSVYHSLRSSPKWLLVSSHTLLSHCDSCFCGTCILTTLPHRLCNNNITDVAQEVMLHMQRILPQARCIAHNKSVDTWASGKHKLCCPRADVALGLRPGDNIKPLCNSYPCINYYMLDVAATLPPLYKIFSYMYP